MCGPVSMLTSSSREKTHPAGFQVVNGTGGNGSGADIPASPAGAIPNSSKSDGGSSFTGMRSAENFAPHKKNGSDAWNSPNGGDFDHDLAKEEQREDACPACESMFGKLVGKKQHVELQLRGEPKSGTSFMYEWAINALMVTCSRLEQLYGRDTCQVSWRRIISRKTIHNKVAAGTKSIEMKEVVLSFQPRRKGKNGRDFAAGPDAACPCENVERVSVTISSLYKHDLPVSQKCRWQHVDDVTPEGKGCTTVAGRQVQNHTDTAECLHENPCEVRDSRLQMLILRDPRAVVVSSFFHVETHKSSAGRGRRGESVDRFAVRMLPTICRFVHLRWLLLHERMADRTVEFMYDESLADPLGWHQRWLSSVGLTPPKSVVEKATNTAVRKEYGFTGKGVDTHPGGKEATPARRWDDEISAEVVEQLNDICRVWLPPALLEKFGVDVPP
eukprot:g11328.t1